MIRTLYRRPDASTSPAAAFVEVEATNPLFGAVPSWRFEDDPPGWRETVAELGDPTSVRVDVVVEDLPPTAPLQLVPRVDVEVVVDDVSGSSRVDACPDCSAAGLDPCRPKGDPVDGRPLTRWHRRRRALVEHRDTGSAASFAVLRMALLIVLVVLAVLAFGQAGSGDERGILVPTRTPSPCPAGTAPGCPDGPRP